MIRFGRTIKIEKFHELLSNREVARIEVRRVKNQHQDKSNLQVHVYAQLEKTMLADSNSFIEICLKKVKKF